MDSGAHFHKCDFQVHTPRDMNWEGAGAVTDQERRQYAQELIAACRARSINALAITDHHDVALFKYIREAALSETDALGKPLAAPERLIVFPGMELTLGIPCQALVIFDSDFPVEFLPQALPALGITPSEVTAEKHAPVKWFRAQFRIFEPERSYGEDRPLLGGQQGAALERRIRHRAIAA
jgi:hypothetical protein